MTGPDDAWDPISCSSSQFLPNRRVIGLGGLRPALQRRDSKRTAVFVCGSYSTLGPAARGCTANWPYSNVSRGELRANFRGRPQAQLRAPNWTAAAHVRRTSLTSIDTLSWFGMSRPLSSKRYARRLGGSLIP